LSSGLKNKRFPTAKTALKTAAMEPKKAI